ncbi:MAG TPA: hypothetical protein VFK09_05285 [Gemmatimonadales bacterium]|nr:hypothetical protein [Gemmatimonadales bacterium]
MTRLRGTLVAGAIALCTTLSVGCGDSTGPANGNLADPAGLSNDVQSLATPFDAPAFRGLAALSGGTTPLTRTTRLLAALAPNRPVPSARVEAARKATFALRALRPSFAAAPAGPGSVIPSTYWGKVYVWDTGTSQYVEGSATGGPANGVRFTVYAIDPITDRPATPLVEVGHVDLVDQSTNSEYKLAVLVADGSLTVADYLVTATSTATSFAASAAGYLTDGTHRLDFANSASAGPSQVQIDYQLSLDQPAVSARLQAALTGDQSSARLATTFTVTRESEVVVLTGSLVLTQTQAGYSASANFVVTVNGAQFATITGSSQSGGTTTYTYTGPSRDLTQEERNALERMFEATGSLSALVDAVFAPIEEILQTGDSFGV